ncbi:hypothetical protein BU16DRAFT_532428 [Lophium mytilinum]|uniref:Uncharacterized protein n=1 Tax=Lophium mytilinum TaxID=390894 RepID=A0A6A6RBR0_9PEZI|nr:hypothetical protein BU16DRAFT_532428 [Lophium mytilinum]
MAKRRTMKECEAQLRILRAARSSTATRKGLEKDITDRGAAKRLRRERKLDRSLRRVQDRVHTLTLRKVEGKMESLALVDPTQCIPNQSVESPFAAHESVEGEAGARQLSDLRGLSSKLSFNMHARLDADEELPYIPASMEPTSPKTSQVTLILPRTKLSHREQAREFNDLPIEMKLEILERAYGKTGTVAMFWRGGHNMSDGSNRVMAAYHTVDNRYISNYMAIALTSLRGFFAKLTASGRNQDVHNVFFRTLRGTLGAAVLRSNRNLKRIAIGNMPADTYHISNPEGHFRQITELYIAQTVELLGEALVDCRISLG